MEIIIKILIGIVIIGLSLAILLGNIAIEIAHKIQEMIEGD